MELQSKVLKCTRERRASGLAALAVGLLCVSCASQPNAAATSASPPAVPPSIVATSSTATAARIPAGIALPRLSLTPGESFVGVTAAEVCTPGWSSRHRNVASKQYREVYGEYGIRYPEPTGSYELDHLIPLELGGDNANANLWPEAASPAPGFHQKDALENALHAQVCDGALGLVAAQHEIASNWYGAYIKNVIG